MAEVIRPAEAGDIDDLVTVLCSAYDRRPDDERLRVESSWAGYLVIEVDGAVVGTLRVMDETLWYAPGCTVRKADVGHVAVRRECQGRGLGTALMASTVEHLRETGFALSRLGGLMHFYRRFGYVPFPRRFYQFPLTAASGGARQLGPEAYLRLDDETAPHVRPYHPERDWSERGRLERLQNDGLLGAYAAPEEVVPESGPPDASKLRWVYEEQGRLHAVVYAYVNPTESSLYAWADPRHPRALGATVRRALLELAERGVAEAQGRLPFDTRVESALIRGGVGFIQREVYTAPAGNMMLVVNLAKLAAAAVPEWSRRVAGTSWRGVLDLRAGDQSVKLAVSAAGMAVTHQPATAALRLGPREFLLMALGHRSFAELRPALAETPSEALTPLLTTLFPRVPTAAGPLG